MTAIDPLLCNMRAIVPLMTRIISAIVPLLGVCTCRLQPLSNLTSLDSLVAYARLSLQVNEPS